MKKARQPVKGFEPEEYVDSLINVINKSEYNYFPRLETLKKLDKRLGGRLRVVTNYLELIDLAKEKSGLVSYIEIEKTEKEKMQLAEKEQLLLDLTQLSDFGNVRLKKKLVIECLGNRGYNKVRKYFGGIENTMRYIPNTKKQEVVNESYM